MYKHLKFSSSNLNATSIIPQTMHSNLKVPSSTLCPTVFEEVYRTIFEETYMTAFPLGFFKTPCPYHHQHGNHMNCQMTKVSNVLF